VTAFRRSPIYDAPTDIATADDASSEQQQPQSVAGAR